MVKKLPALHKKLILVVCVLALFSSGIYLFIISPPVTHSGDKWSFTGKITEQVNDCGVDGECSITVRNRKVFTDCGLSVRPEAVCQTDAVPKNLKVGDRVRVTAKKTDYGYALDCNDCKIVKK